MVVSLTNIGWKRIRRAHVITNFGRKPSYYPIEGEPLIGDALSQKQALAFTHDDLLGQDWSIITADDTKFQDILDFINDRRIKK